MIVNWTPEREEMLKQLWQQGLSASRIAQELGSTTRNAVIGKAHRLGLSGRTTRKVGPKPASSLSRSSSSATRMPRAISRPRYIEPVERSAYAVNLVDLNEQHCKWPVGDPRSKEFHFCGAARAESFPYCQYHAAVAYHIPMRRESMPQEAPAAEMPAAQQQASA